MLVKELAELAGTTVRTIRFYHQIGLPRIAAMLAEQPAGGTVVTDLNATVDAIEGRLAELTAQRTRILALVASAERGDLLSPMPAVVARFYDSRPADLCAGTDRWPQPPARR